MDASEQIKLFSNFFEDNYKAILSSNSAKELQIPFLELSQHDLDLANELLDSPEDTIKAAESAIKNMDLENNNISVNFIKLPKTQQRHIWEVRRGDVGKMIALKGIINKSSSIVYVCASAKFECPTCGNIINVLQLDGIFKEPSKCACGRKGRMVCLDKELTDTIKLGIIDDLMDEGNKDRSIAREKMTILSGDLTSHKVDKSIKPGRKVIINGFFKYIQKGNTVEFDSMFYANSIEFVKIGWDTVKTKPKEEEQIKNLAKDNDIISRLAQSIADVEGFSEIKITSLLQLAGSPNLYDQNNHLTSRGTIHILLIGDPGGGKTYFVKRAGAISPICSFQSAATASGRGLVASVNQDKDIGAWVIYPGVVPMAHKGIVIIDEIDKTHQDDYGDHNNAMNDMEVVIAKSNVKGRLDTETSYLATANPENRVFFQSEPYYNQIDMPKDFLDRFDIIFPMMSPSEDKDRDRIMDTMLDRHLKESDKSMWNPEFNHDFIRKYIAYCRNHNPNPQLAKDLGPSIKKKLHDLMRPRGDEQAKVSFRQLESILRFAYASARLRLRDITKGDIDLAFNLKRKSFIDLGIINEAGDFSWAKLENIDEEVISDKELIHEVLKEMMPDTDTLADWQDIIERCKQKGVDESKAEEYIQKLKMKGDYFEPIRGKLKRLP